MDVVAERDLLARGTDRRGPAGLAVYRAEKNAFSLDGVPRPHPKSVRLSGIGSRREALR